MTPADVKALAPELATMSDPVLQIYIDVAECLISDSAFCDAACGQKAQLFMAAHLATLGNRSGTPGAVTQEKVGDIARSYGSIAGLDDVGELGATSYGLMVSQLRRTILTANIV